MKTIVLKRLSSTEHGTFGVLLISGIPFAVTMERQWRDNQTGISCIPAGMYDCQRIVSPHFGETFEVMNVPGRSHILFHKGNIEDDSHGCILVGEQFETLHGVPAVLSSRHGYGQYLGYVAGDDAHKLKIINYFEGASY